MYLHVYSFPMHRPTPNPWKINPRLLSNLVIDRIDGLRYVYAVCICVLLCVLTLLIQAKGEIL